MTLLLGFAAVNTGNNLLYLLVSALLGFMAVSGLLGHQNLKGVEIQWVQGQDFFAGRRRAGEIRLFNKRRSLAVFLLRIETSESSAFIQSVAPGSHSCGAVDLIFQQRGYQHLPSFKVSSCFPVNFFVRSLVLTIPEKILVFPSLRPLSLQFAGERQKHVLSLESRERGDEGDIHSIGQYVPGDPLKVIHWKLSARQSQLRVKHLSDQTSATGTLLDLEELPGNIEDKLGYCAYLVEEHYRQNLPVGLRLPDRLLPPATGRVQRYRLLKELALYDTR